MDKSLLFFIFSVVAAKEYDYAANQILTFKKSNEGPIGVLTTTGGAPIDKRAATSSLNLDIVQNEYLMETLSRVAQERIPERIVHGNGAGAFGYFEVTKNISHICKAKLFSKVGKKTPIAVRLSSSITARGGIDTTREAKGFAVKFYTEEGNFDIPGFNTPVFIFKNPLLFTTITQASHRNPATNVPDQNMLWDFLTTNPEALFIFSYILSDPGIPYSYRHMSGHGIHTHVVYNDKGTKSYIRYHFLPSAGLKYLNSTEALEVAAEDPDYYIRDLYNAIASGNFPKWEVSLQILSHKDVEKARKAGLDVFDVTKLLPEDQYPLHPIGYIVLNENPTNYHSDVEMLAFCPSNLVSGMLGSPDKIWESRTLFYKNAQLYRLGVNFNNIPVNYPRNSPALTYYRDGRAPVYSNGGDTPNYYPNSFNGPEPYVEKNRPSLSPIHESEANNFDQIAELYSNKMSSEEKSRFIENILNQLCPVATFLKKRAVEIFKKIHSDLGNRVARGLAANLVQC